MKNIFQRIKDLEVQGATNIAIESLKYLKKFAKDNGFGYSFNRECEKLLRTRPTGVALFNVIAELKKDKSIKRMDELLKKIGDDNKKISEIGLRIFSKNKNVVMTHCHSSEVVSLLKSAKKKIDRVIVTETRPRNQGLLTARELKEADIHVTFIIDSAVAYFMRDVDLVLVGSDSIRKEGIVNKIGTYTLAVAAGEQVIPFYVVASTLKYDRRKGIVIEERAPSEICKKVNNIMIRNPAFDITPWKYISGVITEDGIKKPREILEELRK